MNGPDELVTIVKADPPTPEPRLVGAVVSLQYLLTWTLTTAVFLSLYLAAPGQVALESVTLATAWYAIRFVASVFYGAGLATWLFVFKRWAGGVTNFPARPAHWVVLILSLKELIDAAAIVGAGDVPWIEVSVFAPSIAALAALLAWIIVIKRDRFTGGWLTYVMLRLGTEASTILAAALLLFLMTADTRTEARTVYFACQAMAAMSGALAMGTAVTIALNAYNAGRPVHWDWIERLGMTTACLAPLLWIALRSVTVLGELRIQLDWFGDM